MLGGRKKCHVTKREVSNQEVQVLRSRGRTGVGG